MAQALLTQMGAALVRLVIVAHRPDEAIKAALTRHAMVHQLPGCGGD